LRIGEVFPALAGANEVDRWAGLRPATPGNVPLVGDMAGAGLAGLWLNTGHGTLGWTLACGSGRLLADLHLRARSGPGREPLYASEESA
jgi:D-amino-acid dehydrogenase